MSIEQAGERTGVVRQVAVHLHQRLVAPLQAPAECAAIGAAEPRLGRPAHHLYGLQLSCHCIGDLGGAVGAVVVDDQHGGRGHSLAQPAQDHRYRRRLLVGGNDDQGAHPRTVRSSRPAGAR